MRILITGGAGFIAAATARRLLSVADHDVVLTDLDPHARAITNLVDEHRDRVLARELDVRDATAVREVVAATAPDAVITLAAVMGEEESVDAATLRTAVNVTGTVNVLDAAVRSGVSRVVVASSVIVLGADDFYDPSALPLDESAWPRPNPRHSLYSHGKLYLEAVARWYDEHAEMTVRAHRPSTVYGPGRVTGLAMISDLISDAVAGRADGPSVPDLAINLIHVEDIADQFAALATLPTERLGDRVVLNSGGDATSLAEVAALVEAAVPGARVAHRIAGVPAGDPRERDYGLPVSFDGSAIDRILGHPRRHSPLERGIRAFVDAQRARTAEPIA